MAGTAPRKVTKEELGRAQNMWDGFINISKWSVLLIVGILIGLCLGFIV